jgi:hypothetical protein
MMKRLNVLLLAATLAVSGAASAQPAQVAAPPGVDAVARAEALFQEGMRFVAQKQWADAEQRFLAAWALNPSYDVAANLGHTQNRLGKYKDAARHLAYAIKNWPLVGKREPRELAQRRLAELRASLTSLSIQVSVAGAAVSVDGTPVGTSPLDAEVFVDPGSHVIGAKLNGYEDAKVVVEGTKGAARTATLALSPVTPPHPVPSVEMTAAAERTSTPSTTVAPSLDAGGPNKALLVAGGVTTGLALVVGTSLLVVSKNKASDASTQFGTVVMQHGASACAQLSAPGCQDLHDELESKSALGSAGAWALIGGGVVGVATLVYGLAAPRGPARTGLVVTPLVSAREGGLAVRGSW